MLSFSMMFRPNWGINADVWHLLMEQNLIKIISVMTTLWGICMVMYMTMLMYLVLDTLLLRRQS